MGCPLSHSSAAIRRVDWAGVQVNRGTGEELCISLGRFLGANSTEELATLWWDLEGVAFAQNTLYGAAVPVAEVLTAALYDEHPEFRLEWIVEALRFILAGGSVDDPALPVRCRQAVLNGGERLAALADSAPSSSTRDAVREVLSLVEAS